MGKPGELLRTIRIASPCSARWGEMSGDDRVRHCAQCNLNVYNISWMSRKEAEDLIRSKEGRLCVRFYRRADGTILTDDCPVGLRAVRRRVAKLAAALAALVACLGAGFPWLRGWALRGFYSSRSWGQSEHVLMGKIAARPEMGDVAAPQEMGVIASQ